MIRHGSRIIFVYIISNVLENLYQYCYDIKSNKLHDCDELDLKILAELYTDSSISIPILSKKLGVHSSISYSRIKKLTNTGIIEKFTIDVNESKLGLAVKAHIGIKRDSIHKELIHSQLLKIPETVSLCEITGRFDILLCVNTTNLKNLHTLVIDKIGKIHGISNTETFVELQKTHNDKLFTKI